MNDQMILCERCGVTFLWTIEDQRNATGQPKTPPRCMGCAFLLPDPERARGLVKWYSARKQYGFITPLSGPDLFTHRSGFIDVGRLRQGDLVEFTVAQGEKGPEAVEVQLLFRPQKAKSRQSSSVRTGDSVRAAHSQPTALTSDPK